MTAFVATPPVAFIEELKAWLRLEHGEEDALLHQLVRAATEMVEARLGWLLIERVVAVEGEGCDGRMAVSVSPVRRLVDAVDGDGATLDAHLEGGRRTVVTNLPDGWVRVRLLAGRYADWNAVPEMLRLATVQLAAHFYRHRDGDGDGDRGGLPATVEDCLRRFRRLRMA